ncbi:Hypothetical protein A7982_09182 [Minicystis rosea]|nr:Hypothetical protein A7982_09182 [Minicystis rosea]
MDRAHALRRSRRPLSRQLNPRRSRDREGADDVERSQRMQASLACADSTWRMIAARIDARTRLLLLIA